ncbi:MAG: N-acetylmuramoyl-L-alanine amidase [Deltaproteobacteria bacterium]|nr:N-acetylmuramoyl-L-alanine amidase [Deltaproteobacteria bacterium]
MQLAACSFFLASCVLHLATASAVHAFFVEAQGLKTTSALKIIVIDPGHGGEDTGAIGPSGVKEKDINLEIAKKLEKLILQKMDVKVILTRTDDTFIPLEQRSAIANKSKADLFISIHANAAYRKGASGVETYFLSFDATDEDAKRAADFENAIVSISNKKQDNKNADDLKSILMDMAQTEFLNESSQLAEIIQENLCQTMRRKNRGIKQAPFIVLAGAAMPAVLVEVGFISNAKEEKRLALPQTQEIIAAAIFKGIIKFEDILRSKMGYALE